MKMVIVAVKWFFIWESYQPLIPVCANRMLFKITLGSIYEITITENSLVLSQFDRNDAIEVHVSWAPVYMISVSCL